MLVEPHSRDFCDLAWHTFNTSTGESLASEHKLKWQLAFCNGASPYQAAAQRVVAMADGHTIVVLEAGSLQEMIRIVVTPRGPGVSNLVAKSAHRIQTLDWAPSRPWISVILRWDLPGMPTGIPAVLSEVHIYEAVSGHLLQCVEVSAEARLTWSPSLPQALVHGVHEPGDPGADSNPTEMTRRGHPVGFGTFRILDPARDAVIQISMSQAAIQGCWWCEWTPSGALLKVKLGVITCAIIDGRSGQLVMQSDLSWEDASCASEVETAYLPKALPNCPICIRFKRINGTWQADQQKFIYGLALSRAVISPDARVIAGLKGSWDSFNPPTWNEPSDIAHHNLDTGRLRTSCRDWSGRAGSTCFATNFAHLPTAWPQITAHIHAKSRPANGNRRFRQEQARQRSLKVMEGQAHAVHGSWTVADLLMLTPGVLRPTKKPCDAMEECVWAPNGRHLAILL